MPDTPPLDSASLPTYTNATLLYMIGRVICRIATSTVFHLKAYGTQNIPRRGGVLIVGNHQSFFDPVAYGVQVLRPMSFLAKSELFSNRLFGGLIRQLNAFPVRQGEGDVGAVRETIRRLQDGHVLTMYPEGGRSETGQIQPMLGGIGLIVRRAGPTVRVVPAAIDGAYDAWPKHRKLPRAHPVRVKYGQPLSLSHLKAAEIVTIIDREIRRLHAELRAS